ncbi:MAG: hypothetical protein JXA00_01230 [Candidatus Thermoplasmatota archaeon]|nr:hypothetical protein [Candidatus Thermoplasmatota archaeon]
MKATPKNTIQHAVVTVVLAMVLIVPMTTISVNAEPTDIHLGLTVMLEGSFDCGVMTTDLNTLGYLPLQQPYDSNPDAVWYYTGIESVTAIPNADVVDWVLVELRDAASPACATPTTTISRQAGFLLNDGSIVGLDGTSDLTFTTTITHDLYVVVYHRNHLGVMSALSLDKSTGICTYDFTVSEDRAYGGSTGQKEIIPGTWVMFAADVTGDGQVNNPDKFLWYQYAGCSGYHACDINLDGQVNNPDKPSIEDYWNFGRGSQIPQETTLGLKVYLQGPFDDTEMTTQLNSQGFLPLKQPFDSNSEALWYYTGPEYVSSIPRTDIVDWVLVELRDAPEAALALPSTIVAQEAAFLLNDGTVIGTDGSSNLKFTQTITNQLFVCIYHRNHVGVMSATHVSLSDGVFSYDFTHSAGKAYGGDVAHIKLKAATWGMFACDSNGDGQVNNKDNIDEPSLFNENLGLSGYLPHDWNLDGQVNNFDKLDVRWPQNAGKGTQIPGYSKITGNGDNTL